MTNEAQMAAATAIFNATSAKAAALGAQPGSLTAIKAAFDGMFGEGFYDQFVSDLYDALRAKAAA